MGKARDIELFVEHIQYITREFILQAFNLKIKLAKAKIACFT